MSLAAAPAARQHRHAGKFRQAEIEDDDIEAFALQGMVGSLAVAHPVDGETGLAQADGQAVAQLGIVFDKQDAHEQILSGGDQPPGGDDPGEKQHANDDRVPH